MSTIFFLKLTEKDLFKSCHWDPVIGVTVVGTLHYSALLSLMSHKLHNFK